jgi:hypothetical protein
MMIIVPPVLTDYTFIWITDWQDFFKAIPDIIWNTNRVSADTSNLAIVVVGIFASNWIEFPTIVGKVGLNR